MRHIDLADRLADARSRATPASSSSPTAPYFSTLIRKDVRIREDQSRTLTDCAAQLMKRRAHKAERLTENTLIRVAIDLLLDHAEKLRGSTEAELRASLRPLPPAHPECAECRGAGLPEIGGSAPRDFGTPAILSFPSPELPNDGTPEHCHAGTHAVRKS
jgi:hypothetical protein